jgi:hypothetical protein
MQLHTLDDLEQYLHIVMPQWKSVQQLKRNPQQGFIDFFWQGHHFVVKPSLETFELKNNGLFITGGSLLLQSALRTRTGNETRIVEIADTLRAAEDTIVSRRDEGLALVRTVRKALSNMVTPRKS